MREHRSKFAACAALIVCLTSGLAGVAQGTKQWTVGRYDEFQRGSAEGVAIRNDGRLEPGLTATTLYSAPDGFIWSVAAGTDGIVYAGRGGSTPGAAALVRISRDGTVQTIFSGKELGVQAVRLGPDNAIYAATSPDGKVYRVASAGGETVVFDTATTLEKPKYLWDLAVAPDGTLYVAAGAPAVVYRIRPAKGAAPEVLFRTTDAHIRSLLLAPDGVLWAGSDGAGVIYRLDTRVAGARPFAAYAAGHREITALARDGLGNLYAAAVGAKGASSLPPLPVTGSTGITVTFLQPGSTAATGANTVVPDGSEIDRIAPDGTPERLVALHDDVVYALAIHDGKLLAATGNRGRVFRIDPAVPGQLTEVARLDAGQGTAMTRGDSGVLVGTANGGKVLQLHEADGHARYTSEVFDAGQYARWGRTEVTTETAGGLLFVRTGNVPNPAEGWSDWIQSHSASASAAIPPGRFAQWRADLPAGASIDSVTLNYLPRNVAPVVDEVVIATGARLLAAPAVQQPATVQVVFPSATTGVAQALGILQDTGSAPLTAQKDRTGLVIRWAAHDDNGDDLMFAVWYRGLGESRWNLLKDQISDRFFSFDASLLPDGRYEAKVVASDAPVHTDADTLTGERRSTAFTIDTTPPVPGVLSARQEGSGVHWTFDAQDGLSPIAHAEFSLDAGPWQYVVPTSGLSDSRSEHYDVVSALPPPTPGTSAGAQHVLAVRVYDRAENMASAKTVVR